MRLADDDILVSIGSETMCLRPTLRAAIRLERLHDGFQPLFEGITSGTLSTIIKVIAETSTTPTTPDKIQTLIAGQPLATFLLDLTVAALSVSTRLTGHDEERPAPPSQGKPVPFRQHHLELFRIATGNLGWTPEQAYQATPGEILEAHRGRADLLRSIFGGEAPHDDQPDFNATLDRDGLNRLRGKGRLR